MSQAKFAEMVTDTTRGTGWGYWVVAANKSGWYWVGDPNAKPSTPPTLAADAPSYPVDTAWDTTNARLPLPWANYVEVNPS